ncbi:MAG TPA: hypothetical protein VFH04_04205 [Nitrososphaeraceae archaeon]|nr:hypothetical protein [Nitrososphaeraceae archaeon]
MTRSTHMRIMQKEDEQSYAFITGNDHETEYTVCSASSEPHRTIKLSLNMVVARLKDLGYQEMDLRADIEE